MISSTIFSLPVPTYRQPKISVKHGHHARKRKRTEIDDINESKSIDVSRETDLSQKTQSQQASQVSEYSAVLAPEERSLYRVAGQPLDQILPRKPFPHAPQAELDDASKKKKSTSNRLASLDPPLFAASLDPRTLPLHQQHLAAVTALLHRALSEGDFARAGRALSLVLRDTIRGEELDIRAEGRWGIGAEILLRQGTQAGFTKMDLSIDKPNETKSLSRFDRGRATWFSRKGFEDSRKYYERLIVQYPFHKPNPGAVNAVDFYPAMFGLWIYVVQEESKLKIEAPATYASSETSQGENSASLETRSVFSFAWRQRTLAQAREIAARMDSCMTTIPYSDDFELIRLRGMVSSWIADLIDDLVDDQSTRSGELEDDEQADVVASARFSRSPVKWSEDDATRGWRLEAEQARQKALEMRRKLQGRLDGFD